MKNYFFAAAILCLITVFASCKKNGGAAQLPEVVTWKIDGGAQQSADSVSFLRLFNLSIIYGTKGTTTIFVSFNSTNPGTYTLFGGSAGFGIMIAGIQYGNVSGDVTITSNANSRLSGNFTALFNNTGPGTFTLTGTFSNVRYY